MSESYAAREPSASDASADASAILSAPLALFEAPAGFIDWEADREAQAG